MSANLLRVRIKHLRRIGVLFCPAHKALFAKHKVMVDMSILIHFINLIFLQEKKLVVVRFDGLQLNLEFLVAVFVV